MLENSLYNVSQCFYVYKVYYKILYRLLFITVTIKKLQSQLLSSTSCSHHLAELVKNKIVMS